MRQPIRKRALLIALACAIVLLCIVYRKYSVTDKAAGGKVEEAESTQGNQSADGEIQGNSENDLMKAGEKNENKTSNDKNQVNPPSENISDHSKMEPIVTEKGVELPEMDLVDSDSESSEKQNSEDKAASAKNTSKKNDSAANPEKDQKSNHQPAANESSSDKTPDKHSTTVNGTGSGEEEAKTSSTSEKTASVKNQNKPSSEAEESTLPVEAQPKAGKWPSEGIELPTIRLD